ncbi:MAG: hypothetical protein LH628_01285 [Microcoleus sp. CAN_BIN18]|nr:hypothetical protein [Microcoleus sp. CAN_BIN18]
MPSAFGRLRSEVGSADRSNFKTRAPTPGQTPETLTELNQNTAHYLKPTDPTPQLLSTRASKLSRVNLKSIQRGQIPETLTELNQNTSHYLKPTSLTPPHPQRFPRVQDT